MVDRREYLPYCPICGSFFHSAREICLLNCRHFFCANCVSYFGGQMGYICPFDGEPSGVRDGEFMGEAVEFLSGWVTLLEQFSTEEIVDRLLAEIPMVRKNLNFKAMPCRIGTQCTRNFCCPCDHTLQRYHSNPCPKQDCQNQECMFDHSQRHSPQPSVINKPSSAVQPAPSVQQTPAVLPAQQGGKQTGAKPNEQQVEEARGSGCCQLA